MPSPRPYLTDTIRAMAAGHAELDRYCTALADPNLIAAWTAEVTATKPPPRPGCAPSAAGIR